MVSSASFVRILMKSDMLIKTLTKGIRWSNWLLGHFIKLTFYQPKTKKKKNGEKKDSNKFNLFSRLKKILPIPINGQISRCQIRTPKIHEEFRMITRMPFSEEPCENDFIAYLQHFSHQQQCVIILLTLGMELVSHSSYDQPLSHYICSDKL